MINMEKKLNDLEAMRAEIDALREDPDVLLAQKYDHLMYVYGNTVSGLNQKKRRGAKLREEGYTLESMDGAESGYEY